MSYLDTETSSAQWVVLVAETLDLESRSRKIERSGFRWLEMSFKNLILFHSYLISGHSFLISCNFEQFWIYLKRWWNFIFHGFIPLNANLMSVYMIPCYKWSGMFFVKKTRIIYGVQDSNLNFESLSAWQTLPRTVTSMDLRDEICWWQYFNVNDSFGHFRHQRSKDVTNIAFQSPMWTVLKLS